MVQDQPGIEVSWYIRLYNDLGLQVVIRLPFGLCDKKF